MPISNNDTMAGIASSVAQAVRTLEDTIRSANQVINGYVNSYNIVASTMLNDVISIAPYASTYAGMSTNITGAGSHTPVTRSTIKGDDSFTLSGLPSFDRTIGNVLRNLSMPAITTTLTNPITAQPIWNDTYWINLKNKLNTTVTTLSDASVTSLVNSLSSPVTAAEDAMYQRDLQRKQQLLKDLQSAANAQTGKLGFTYPNSITTALLLDAQQKYSFDLNQISRDLIKFCYDWAQSNYQFAIATSVDAQKADADFNVRYAQVLVEVFNANVSAAIEKLKAEMTLEIEQAHQSILEYNTEVEGIIKKYSAYTTAITSAYSAENSATTNAYSAYEKARLEAETTKITAYQIKSSIMEAGDKVAIAKYAERIKDSLGAKNYLLEAQTKDAMNKITAAEATVKNASALASMSSQIAIATVTGNANGTV